MLSLKDLKKGKYYKYEVRYEYNGYYTITVFKYKEVFVDLENKNTAYICCNNVAHIFNNVVLHNLDFSIKDYILELNSFNEKMKFISPLSKRDYYNIVRLFNQRSNGVF